MGAGEEAVSPVQLPNSKVYLETRSGGQRLMPGRLYSCLESTFPRRLIPSMNY